MTPTFKGLGTSLAALKHNLDLLSAPLAADIESLATEAPDLIKQATVEVAKTKQAVADIKDFVSGLKGTNGAPTLTDSSDVSAASAGGETVQTETVAAERLDVHGVSLTPNV